MFRFDAEIARRWGTASAEQIAAAVGCSVATVYDAAQRLQLPRRNRGPQHRWSPAEDDRLRETFGVERPHELEAAFGLSFEQIRTRAKRLQIRSRQVLAREVVRHDYFDGDSPDVAYFAGLHAADGWIGQRNVVNLALKVSDRAMVDRFAEVTCTSRPVAVYKGQARASVTSAPMVAALDGRWSIRAAKTTDLQPPNVDDPILRLAYVAGHLDGDGFIAGPGTGQSGAVIRCGALGTEPVIRWIADVLDAALADRGRRRPVRVRRLASERYSFPMFEWRTSDHNAIAILDAMRDVIGDLGIRRKWAVHERQRAVLAARTTTTTKGAAA